MRLSSYRFPALYGPYGLLLWLSHLNGVQCDLNGYISIIGSSEYEDLTDCQQECLYLQSTETHPNGLVNILDCDLPVPNACYCNSDKLQLATSAVSSCITADCTNVAGGDITSAIAAYTDYCNSVVGNAYATATTTGTGATTTPGPTTTSVGSGSSSGNGNGNSGNGNGNNGNGNGNGGNGNGCNENSGTCIIQSSGTSKRAVAGVSDRRLLVLFALVSSLVLSAAIIR